MIEKRIKFKVLMLIKLFLPCSNSLTGKTQKFEFIYSCNYKEFKDTWDFLNARFFCLLDASYVESVDSFLDSLQKLFIVTCIKKGKPDEVSLSSPFHLGS